MFLFQIMQSENQRPHILQDFFSSPKTANFTPEYNYRTFFFTVDQQKEQRLEQFDLAKKILSASPDTKVVFFAVNEHVAGRLADFIKNDKELAKFPSGDKIEVKVGVYTQDTQNYVWARDFGAPAGGEANPQYVTGWNPVNSVTRDVKLPVDRETAKKYNVTEMPAVLQGGNFTKTMVNGKSAIIIGSNDIIQTQKIYEEKYNYKISIGEIAEIYKKSFDAGQVIILGINEKDGSLIPQDNGSWNFYHIDQSVFFPKEGVAVMLDFESVRKDPGFQKLEQFNVDRFENMQKTLDLYEDQLRKAGFTIIKIPNTAEHVRLRQNYTNSIPIQSDKGTTIIMPSFDDKKTERQIRKILKSNGMKVEFVRDTFNMGGADGNIHCMTGALSFNDMAPKTEQKFA